jgi:hypothetical protein
MGSVKIETSGPTINTITGKATNTMRIFTGLDNPLNFSMAFIRVTC